MVFWKAASKKGGKKKLGSDRLTSGSLRGKKSQGWPVARIADLVLGATTKGAGELRRFAKAPPTDTFLPSTYWR